MGCYHWIAAMRGWWLWAGIVGSVGCTDRQVQPCAAPVAAVEAAEPPACDAGCSGGTSPACTPPLCGRQLELEWLLELDEAPCDRGPVVAAELPDLALVAGGTRSAPGSTQRWVAAVSRTGCVEWVDIEGELARRHEALVFGIAAHPDHGAYAVGKVDQPADDGTEIQTYAWVRRYRSDGSIDWTRDENGELDRVASGVAVDLDGSAIVVGGSGDGLGHGWLRRYGTDGTRRDRWTLDGADPTHVLDVAISTQGRRWVSGWTEDDAVNGSFIDVPVAFAAGLDDSDDIEWLAPASWMTSGRLAQRDTTLVLVGPRSSVTRWSTDGAEQWTSGSTLEPLQFEALRGDVMQEGLIVVAGSRRSVPLVVLLEPTGTLAGVSTIPGIDLGEATDVSVADDGAVFVAGLHRRMAVDQPRCTNWLALTRLR